MKDIALAGFMLTAEEWRSLDVASRQQLVAAASTQRDDAWVIANLATFMESGPTEEPTEA